MMRNLFFLLALWLLSGCAKPDEPREYDVAVLGSGTGAIAAGLQAARSGAQTFLAGPMPWHGGMLTSAGVSAIDGNHHLPAGLWGEFRQALYQHYGGPEAVATGWVSMTQFEPHVGAAIFEKMARGEPNLTVLKEQKWGSIKRVDGLWAIEIPGQGAIRAKVLIDGTDLGDVAAAVGAAFDLGMDSREDTGEAPAPQKPNSIIQDLTYVAVLKDYGPGQAPLLQEPPAYEAAEFFCICEDRCAEPGKLACQQMLDYGKLPNGKYMINWPIEGNDYYYNPVGQTDAQRMLAYERAKDQTRRFVYYLQQELGYTHLGLADDEFPSEDRMALMPYHREGRRVHGLARVGLQHMLNPYTAPLPLYRAAIAVGDYPVDHHHDKNPVAPAMEFPPVPSFSIPAGSLVPSDVPWLLIADKAISVTNVANGSTRLQPVILQAGQVAGLMAALSAARGIAPSELPVRLVQQAVLDAGGYLLPFYDLPAGSPHFQAVQRAAAAGLLLGEGEPYKWANRTWVFPDSALQTAALLAAFEEVGAPAPTGTAQGPVSLRAAVQWLDGLSAHWQAPLGWPEDGEGRVAYLQQLAEKAGLGVLPPAHNLTRAQWAVLADELLKPFEHAPVDMSGRWLRGQ